MDSKLSVFVIERNVENYVSRLRESRNPVDRDIVLRLLAEELEKMGYDHEHVENGERRLIEGRHRLEMQRAVVARLSGQDRSTHPDAFLLETLEAIQRVLERHLLVLLERHRQSTS